VFLLAVLPLAVPVPVSVLVPQLAIVVAVLISPPAALLLGLVALLPASGLGMNLDSPTLPTILGIPAAAISVVALVVYNSSNVSGSNDPGGSLDNAIPLQLLCCHFLIVAEDSFRDVEWKLALAEIPVPWDLAGMRSPAELPLSGSYEAARLVLVW